MSEGEVGEILGSDQCYRVPGELLCLCLISCSLGLKDGFLQNASSTQEVVSLKTSA